MGRNNYTLGIMINGEITEVAKGALVDFDRVTTEFKSQKQFLQLLAKEYGVDVENAKLTLTYQNNQQTKFTSPLYAKDKMVLNTTALSERILMRALDVNFIQAFIERYSKGQLREDCNNILYYARLHQTEVRGATQLYLDALQRLLDKLFKSYKSIRDIYVFLDHYEERMYETKKDDKTLKTDAELLETLKQLKMNLMPLKQVSMFDEAPKKLDVSSNDDYLQYLIDRGDREQIMKMYGNDALQHLVDKPDELNDGLEPKSR